MQIGTTNFRKIFTPELNELRNLFRRHGYELRMAGGVVRDLLLGQDPHDIDFATVATPDEMKKMFDEENIRMINNRGEKHGTVTARINEKNFEVTTLRIDVVTDGRHAQVKFTNDWQLDANRRDLTINAMFLDFDGVVYDYFNGVQDLKSRLVRFVGDPVERIREDYLRILRYFRFYGRIATQPDNHQSDIMQAIRNNVQGLQGISGERLWMELRKIVCGNFAPSIMNRMAELGIFPYLGLPSSPKTSVFQSAYKRSSGLDPLPITLVVALLTDQSDVERVNGRLKLSNDDVNVCNFIIARRDDGRTIDSARYFQDVHVDSKFGVDRDRDYLRELLKYLGRGDLLARLEEWTPATFSVTGQDLFAANVPKGPVFGKTLEELKKIWKNSEYRLTREQLLAEIPKVMRRF